MAAIAANRTELLQIADAVARDKSIDKMVVLHAMEEAMQRAAKARYGSENEIRVEIDPKTGETRVSRYLNVVDLVDNDKTEISLEDAKARNPGALVGDIIAETLPPVDFSRIAAQAATTIDNARLYEQSQRAQEELAHLNEALEQRVTERSEQLRKSGGSIPGIRPGRPPRTTSPRSSPGSRWPARSSWGRWPSPPTSSRPSSRTSAA